MHLTLHRLETPGGGRFGGVGVEGWGHPLEDRVGAQGVWRNGMRNSQRADKNGDDYWTIKEKKKIKEE